MNINDVLWKTSNDTGPALENNNKKVKHYKPDSKFTLSLQDHEEPLVEIFDKSVNG